VLITGGAGFIGSHLSDALEAQGNEVTIIDNLSSGSKLNIVQLEGKVKAVQGDIRDKKLILPLIKHSDLILHMAAALGVDNILKNPIESIATNFYGSEIVLNAATKYDKRIIIASTSEIYGKNSKQPLSENDDRVIGSPQKLRWTYSDAKALEEACAHYLYLSKNLQVTTIRFFNTVGPRQSGKYGMVLPRFVESAISNRPLNIYGDGFQTRVFCHVEDSVNAVISLIKNVDTIGQVYNVGGVQEISIRNLAEFIINETNSNSEIKYIDYNSAYRVGFEDMKRRTPDISKIKSTTGWKPIKTLKQIVADVESYFNYKNLGQP
jgi:UDP-glucose 4-epimerase